MAAKIIQIRVDERLMHGQASVWMQSNGANSVIVANDESAANQTQQELMKVTVPEGVRCRFYGVKQLIEIWPKAADWQIFYIVVKNVDDLYQLAKGGLPIEEVNLGNIHMNPERKRITGSINLSAHEGQLIREMLNMNIRFNTQSLPGMTKGLVDIGKFC